MITTLVRSESAFLHSARRLYTFILVVVIINVIIIINSLLSSLLFLLILLLVVFMVGVSRIFLKMLLRIGYR
jgi:hypothetical protein